MKTHKEKNPQTPNTASIFLPSPQRELSLPCTRYQFSLLKATSYKPRIKTKAIYWPTRQQSWVLQGNVWLPHTVLLWFFLTLLSPLWSVYSPSQFCFSVLCSSHMHPRSRFAVIDKNNNISNRTLQIWAREMLNILNLSCSKASFVSKKI